MLFINCADKNRLVASRPHKSIASSLGLIGILLTLAACAPTPSDIRQTTYGPIQGELNEGVAIFRGIPFAAPPVGDLRWQAPQAPESWTETFKATTAGPACWQESTGGNAIFLERLTKGAGMGGFTQWMLTNFASLADQEVSEDCLTLNIITPQIDHTNSPLPVMFWIHGGGHQSGSGSGPYESPSLAKKGVVLVSINYRLGLYGFLAHPELAAEDPNHSSGNYGMLDQIAALQWVTDNISAFGGDPNNITIFGESAGGHSVGQLMASPLSKNLFHRAIAQSGTGFYQFQATDAAHERMSGFDAGRLLAKKAGVSGGLDGVSEIAALRQKSTEELAKFASDPDISSTLHPQIDGYVLPTSTAHIFDSEQQASVPLIVGSNADEGSVLYYLGLPPVDGGIDPQPQTVKQWDELLNNQFGDQAKAVGANYAVDTDTQVVKAAEQLMGDTWFGRHAFYMAQKHSAAGHPTYLYFYERHPPSENQTIGASHALELSHVFGGFIPFWPTDERDEELGNQMQTYWTQFAASGNPNGAETNNPSAQDVDESWAAFSDLQPQEMAFGHDASHSRPVARVERYRAMQAQLDRRMAAVEQTVADNDEM